MPGWSWPIRVLFRFAVCYFGLYQLPLILLKPLDTWVGVQWFGLEAALLSPSPSGSGDKTIDWVHSFTLLVLAALGTVIWSILDRKRTEYTEALGWSRLILRYVLAFALLGYGFAKVFPTQFRPTALFMMHAQFGDFSPMAVLWSFMGASMGYTIFSGAMEVLAGVLLVIRRTALLGALVSVAVMTNVFALNMFYDVPVKLYSFHLLLMAVFIAAPDFARMFRFLVLHKPTEPPLPAGPVSAIPSLRVLSRIAQGLVILLLVGRAVSSMVTYNQFSSGPRPALYGMYEVVKSEGGPDSWRWVTIGYDRYLQVWTTAGTMEGYTTEWKDGSLMLHWGQPRTLTYRREGSGTVMLEGDWDGTLVHIELRPVDPDSFRLRSRGFHWVNEVPFNRAY